MTASRKISSCARSRTSLFEKALYRCSAAQLDDPSLIPGALAEIVAGLVISSRATNIDLPRLMIGVASRFSDIGGALDRRLDREAYFKAETKDHALAVILALEGEAAAIEARKLKKDDVVQRAALLAKDRHWLPDIFADATRARPKDNRSTAQAMAEAIEADELQEAETSESEDEEIDDVRPRDEEEAEEALFWRILAATRIRHPRLLMTRLAIMIRASATLQRAAKPKKIGRSVSERRLRIIQRPCSRAFSPPMSKQSTAAASRRASCTKPISRRKARRSR